jgi:hypothetical protein
MSCDRIACEGEVEAKPRCASRLATCLLTADYPHARATAEKLPLSTTRTNILIAASRSMNYPAALPIPSWE